MNTLTQKSWAWFSQALTQHDTFSGYLQPLIQMVLPQWTTDAYRARVIEIRDEMEDMYSIVLKPLNGILDKKWSSFQAGQFIELMVEKQGSRTLRCFSISSSPANYNKTGLIELSIRIQENGRMTPWLRKHLNSGDLVNISQAQGEFVLPDKTYSSAQMQKVLFIAGGSGITPFRSMLQQQAQSNDLAAKLDIHLLYYSRTNQHILFKKELEELQKESPGLSVTFVDSEKEGFVCEQHLQNYCSDYYQRNAFICGPAPMIQQARKVLSQLDVTPDNINFEFFGAVPIELDNSSQSAVLFQASNKVAVSEDSQTLTLLEQAEEQGLTPVSGCRIGVCHQCICKKKSGVVFNTRTQEYSDTGSEEIQLCISVAQGEVVLDL